MRNNIFIFEGYDGSGKSTLINRLSDALRRENITIRVIGRKNEILLRPLSLLIEAPKSHFSVGTEILLRIALELQRLKLVEEARRNFDLVVLDRGPISLKAWVDYYSLNAGNYLQLFQTIDDALKDAIIFLCTCDFERCWVRIQAKGKKSRKELMGKDVNREWFQKFLKNCEACTKSERNIVPVDTTLSVKESLSVILEHILSSSHKDYLIRK